MSAPPLKREALGCSCASFSCVALPIATLSHHALSYAKVPGVPFAPEGYRLVFIMCQAPSAMPTWPQPDRAEPTRARNVIAYAQLASAPSSHALLVCETSSGMPTQIERQRAVPWSVRNVIAYAQL